MAQPPPTSLEAEIAERLAGTWRAETALDPQTVRFIDATYSTPTAAELSVRLAEEDPELDGLPELVFSPDESHHLAVEPLLNARDTVPDEAEVAARLAAGLGRARFRLPSGRGAIEVEITPELAAGFVRRLALSRRIPEALHGMIADDAERLRVRVVLRTSGVEFTPARIGLIGRLVKSLVVGGGEVRQLLAFGLEVIKGVAAEDELWRYLTERKRRLASAVEQDLRQAARLARVGFEVAQSGGRRLAWVDRPAAEAELRSIDRLSIAVFGRLPGTADTNGLTC
jgi:hypothetical protein